MQVMQANRDDDDDNFELLCDDLLELILLLLGSPICLVRAASVCRRWRRVIAAADGFLRRIRSLHRPTVYGHYSTGHHASFTSFIKDYMPERFFLPSPSVAIGGSHLSPVFLRSYREILDSCGTLLLLRPSRFTFAGITVYEPLTRLYRRIDKPMAPRESKYCSVSGAYLLGGGDGTAGDDEAAASMSNFRVVCTFYDQRHEGALQAAVLLISDHHDDDGADTNGWRFTTLDVGDDKLGQRNFVGRVGGSIYWSTRAGRVHVLNGITMEVSSFMFPDMEMWDSYLRGITTRRDIHHSRVLRVVDCGGAARIVCFAGRNLEVFARPAGGEWAPAKSVRLPEDTRPFVPPSCEGYYLFQSCCATMVAAGAGFVVFAPTEYCQMLFHMDLDTEVVTLKAKGWRYNTGLQFPCELPWPPPIRACVDDDTTVCTNAN